MTDRTSRRTAWLLLVCWSAVIWFMNTRTKVPETANDTLNDVIWQGAHILGHVLLGMLALQATSAQWAKRGTIAALLIVVPHGVLDELVQHLVPGRNMNVTDIACNVGGGITGILIYSLWHRLQSARERDPVANDIYRR